MAITKVKKAKNFCNDAPSNLLATFVEIAIPIKVATSISGSNGTSREMPACKSPTNPSNDLSEIIKSDAPTAFFIGIPRNKTSAGIIKKPPPAPKTPVTKPTTAPSVIIKATLELGFEIEDAELVTA